MRYLLIPAFLTLAACQSSMPFDPVSDHCGSLNYLSLVGSKEDALQSANLPEGTRIIRPGTPTTRDYRQDRLNVHINEKGRIERIVCG